MRFGLVLGGAVAAVLMVANASGQTGENAAVKDLVTRFLAAEKAYDAAALGKLVDGRYVEVSPAGEVDAHDRFLGFYAPEKKADWPPMTVSDEDVRVFGDTAIEIVKFSYAMPGPAGAPARSMEIRGSFVAKREGGAWKLIGAQYTGIRPVPAAAAK